MGDFLGIPKRKWLAFAIFSALMALINVILASFIAEYFLHRQADLVRGAVISFVVMFILPVIAYILLGKVKEIFKIKIAKRYLAALAFALAITFGFPPGSGFSSWAINEIGFPMFLALFVGTIVFWFIWPLIVYVLSDFLAGLAFPSVPAKSKSNKKKSKN